MFPTRPIAPLTRSERESLDMDRWSNEVMGALLGGRSVREACSHANRVMDDLGPYEEEAIPVVQDNSAPDPEVEPEESAPEDEDWRTLTADEVFHERVWIAYDREARERRKTFDCEGGYYLSPMHRRFLDATGAFWQEHRRGPTALELADAVGLTSDSMASRQVTVSQHMRSLQDFGLVGHARATGYYLVQAKQSEAVEEMANGLPGAPAVKQERILKLLEGGPMSTAEIQRALADGQTKGNRLCLWRLRAKGLVREVLFGGLPGQALQPGWEIVKAPLNEVTEVKTTDEAMEKFGEWADEKLAPEETTDMKKKTAKLPGKAILERLALGPLTVGQLASAMNCSTRAAGTSLSWLKKQGAVVRSAWRGGPWSIAPAAKMRLKPLKVLDNDRPTHLVDESQLSGIAAARVAIENQIRRLDEERATLNNALAALTG